MSDQNKQHIDGLRQIRDTVVNHRRTMVAKAIKGSVNDQLAYAKALQEVGGLIAGIDAAIADEKKLNPPPAAVIGRSTRG